MLTNTLYLGTWDVIRQWMCQSDLRCKKITSMRARLMPRPAAQGEKDGLISTGNDVSITQAHSIIFCHYVTLPSASICVYPLLFNDSRSQWPRDIRHEMFSSARTLGTWVRIPLKGMGICLLLFCVCVVLCVGSSLALGWSPVQRVLPTVYRIKKLKKRPGSNKKDCRDLDRHTDIHTRRQIDR
jgi:hypothetical protein